MASISDQRRQIDILDRQIVELLSRRMDLVRQVTAQLSDDESVATREEQVLSNWLEEAIDFDLDEASMEKICRAVIEMGRKARDS